MAGGPYGTIGSNRCIIGYSKQHMAKTKFFRLTDHKLNVLKILQYEFNEPTVASEIEKVFKRLYGRLPGNIYEDLRDLCMMGYAMKDEDTLTYLTTETGRKLLHVKCGDPPTLDMVYNGIIIERIKLSEPLFRAIQKEATKDHQAINDWVVNVLEIAAGADNESEKAKEI